MPGSPKKATRWASRTSPPGRWCALRTTPTSRPRSPKRCSDNTPQKQKGPGSDTWPFFFAVDYRADSLRTIVPTLRLGMPFWTLCVLPITARQACAGFPAIHA
ncbi:hypothetical protein GE543_14655 [Pseudomonas sp. SZ57]|nr:hypothetical protein [Pseudomonas sp. SZ57]